MEQFKMVCRDKDGMIFFKVTEGEEVFQHKGHRFFAHRYYRNDNPEWRVSCALSGAAVGWSPFYDDAIVIARLKIQDKYDIYVKSLKVRPRPKWRLREG